jgi:hypothetical protein
MKPYIGANTGKRIDVEISENDSSVQLFRNNSLLKVSKEP